MGATEATARRPAVQTLDRGLTLLNVIATHVVPVSLAELSAEMSLHRSIVYRLLCTLQDHHLVAHAETGYLLGTAVHSLGRRVMPSVQRIVKPEVTRLSARTGLTAFFAVRDGEEAVTLVSVEVESAHARLAYNLGTRHPLTRGAPGVAMLSAEPPRQGERREVAVARVNGYALTRGEVIPHLATLAVPISSEPQVAFGAMAIAFSTERPSSDQLEAVRQSAAIVNHKITCALSGGMVLPRSG